MTPSPDHPATTAPEFTVGLVQMACGPDAARNREAARTGVQTAVQQGGADIVCLQELFATQYFCQTQDARFFDLAEEIPGPSTEQCSTLARELGVVIVAPVFERRAAGVYHNSAAVIDSTGDLLGVYRKLHIPDDPQYFEKFYFTPGDRGYGVFETRVAKIGVLICWDQWYPEAARLTALQGAEVIFYPSAIGWLPADRGNRRRRAAGRLADHATGSRDRKRCLRRDRQSCRPRGRPRASVLGPLVHLRSVRDRGGRSLRTWR